MASQIELQEVPPTVGGLPGIASDQNWLDRLPLISLGQLNVPQFTRAEILDQLLRVREDERRRMGQELHDSAGQLLVSLQLSVAHLRHVQDASSLDNMLDEIRDTVSQIDREIRALSFLNCPTEMGSHGLPSALQALGRGFARRANIRVRIRVSDNPLIEHGAAPLALLRVAQEALVNIHRHARAQTVNLALTVHDGIAVLLISDDGVGLPTADELEQSHGLGLQGMRHRVEELGGELEMRRGRRGTRLCARVPLRP